MEVPNKHDPLVPSPSRQGREPSATFVDSAEKQDKTVLLRLSSNCEPVLSFFGMAQLKENTRIVFQSLQGVGGAGNHALCSVIFLELVQESKYAKYTSFVSVVYSLSLLFGPIFGGAINESSTLRRIFLLKFPNLLRSDSEKSESARTDSTVLHRRVDVFGAAMLLVATTLLVAALQGAGTAFAWKSAFVIILLTTSGLTWPAFLFWERRVTLIGKEREPAFPWRFVQSRVWVGMLLCDYAMLKGGSNAVFLGGPWFVAIFQLLRRLQLVNNLDPLEAGLRFIPFTTAAPIGSIIVPTIAKTAKVPPIYLVVFASVVQVVGFALLSTLPTSNAIARAQYGRSHEFGSPVPRHGGVIGLAIVTAALNRLVRSKLRGVLSHAHIEELLRSAAAIASTSAADRDQI
ncbi:MAG: hypothetical protein Q9173_002423 [Seirophora scorigena]